MCALWKTPEIKHIFKELASLKHEVTAIFYVAPHGVTYENHRGQGSTTRAEMPRIAAVKKGCVDTGTKTVILVHNHPSINGFSDATPSDEDLLATAVYKEALMCEGIVLLDHIIVAPRRKPYSFKKNGLL